jgi:hypothetical protein
MMPKTKLPIPEPIGTEFENFDRFMRLIVPKPLKPVPVKKPKAKKGDGQ